MRSETERALNGYIVTDRVSISIVPVLFGLRTGRAWDGQLHAAYLPSRKALLGHT